MKKAVSLLLKGFTFEALSIVYKKQSKTSRRGTEKE
jgi:hypothetical protein